MDTLMRSEFGRLCSGDEQEESKQLNDEAVKSLMKEVRRLGKDAARNIEGVGAGEVLVKMVEVLNHEMHYMMPTKPFEPQELVAILMERAKKGISRVLTEISHDTESHEIPKKADARSVYDTGKLKGKWRKKKPRS